MQASESIFKKIINEEKLYNEKPAKFLAAWKRGVKLAGEDYFIVIGTVDDATDKNQLRPNYEVIDRALSCVSGGEAIFLAALYSFYNAYDGQRYLEQVNNPNITDLACLDREHVEIISELFLNYTGSWL